MKSQCHLLRAALWTRTYFASDTFVAKTPPPSSIVPTHITVFESSGKHVGFGIPVKSLPQLLFSWWGSSRCRTWPSFHTKAFARFPFLRESSVRISGDSFVSLYESARMSPRMLYITNIPSRCPGARLSSARLIVFVSNEVPLASILSNDCVSWTLSAIKAAFDNSSLQKTEIYLSP